MRTHDEDTGEPVGVESLFTMLNCRLVPLVALAYELVESGTVNDGRAANALAEGIIAFEEDLKQAGGAASDEALGFVRRTTRERIGGGA